MTDSVSTPPNPCQAYPDPIPGMIAHGSVTIIAGAPGVGKTALFAEWCARWRDGRTICGLSTHRPTAQFYLAADREWASHQRWFDLAGFSDIPHYSLIDDFGLDLNKFRKQPDSRHKFLLDAIDRFQAPRGSLIHIDPIGLFIPGKINDAYAVAIAMAQMTRYCRQQDVNINAFHHAGKQKADPNSQFIRPQDRIAGSHAFIGFTNCQVYVLDPNPPEEPFYRVGWVPHNSIAGEMKFLRDEQGLFIPYDLMVELHKIDRLLACVPYDETKTSRIVDAMQRCERVSVAQAERYLSNLVETGRVRKIRHGRYQRLRPS